MLIAEHDVDTAISPIGRLLPDADLRRRLPAQTPIEIRFRYVENGRLVVRFQVEETDKTLQHEIARENSLTS